MTEPQPSLKKAAVFIDYENIHWGMENQFHVIPQPDTLVKLLTEDFSKRGVEVLIGKAFADWEDFPELQAAFKKKRIEPVYVLTKTTNILVRNNGGKKIKRRKNSADISLCLDAQEALFTRGEIDTFIFVTGDRDFLDIVSRCKSVGKTVIIYGVGGQISRELTEMANEVVQIEKLFGLSPAGMRPVPSPRSGDFDWAPFIKTLDSLSKTLPFVGLKYFLKNIVTPTMGCGNDEASKHDLLNTAISLDIIKVERIANPKDAEHPVATIKLNLDSKIARSILQEAEFEKMRVDAEVPEPKTVVLDSQRVSEFPIDKRTDSR